MLLKTLHSHIINSDLCVFVFQMDVDDEMSEALYSELLELEKVVRRKLSERNADD